MTPEDAAVALRAVSALRALCLALPHLETPAEALRLERFEELVASPGSAGSADTEAVVTGWRKWWREWRTDDLLRMAAGLSARLIAKDRRLATYAVAAREASAGGGHRGYRTPARDPVD